MQGFWGIKMQGPLHIIEPTLVSDAGHCSSFVRSICGAAGTPAQIMLWAGKEYTPSDFLPLVKVKGYFHRRWRKVQGYFLYRALLRQPGRVFVATAGRTDLLLLDWAARGEIPPRKVFCFIHWLRLDEKKQLQLRRIALRQPGLVLLAPTELIAAQLRDCAFKNVQVVPYPITSCPVAEQQAPGFRHILSAGAARADKGIVHIAAFVAHLEECGENIPMIVQSSPDHYGKYDDATRQALARMAALSYPPLTFQSETLPLDEYFWLFNGAICLQLYDRQDFADRISGITLDAMSCGAPVVALSGTWIARVVSRFSAGEVVAEVEPVAVLDAVRRIMADYETYRGNARRAGEALQAENSGEHLYRILMAEP
ncbi:MAG: hypothetical protein GJT30_16675 [Geobacter sp.]|nr:hypothetical protein [Geobacter sp.]